MPMKCVGWIEGTNNSAYVSYIQTWLQGSDYDIDKAYIMGQSFTENGLYIGWSSLFDYSSIKTLQASKTLPLPKGTVLEFVENPEVSIENELADIVATVDKASKIRKIGKLITKIDKNLGKYSYTTNSKEYENIQFFQ